MNSIFSKLPAFPRDPMSQVIWIDRLKEILTNRDTEIKNLEVDVVTIAQGSVPSQANWESAYTTQTGKSLPIPPSARLIWFNTNINAVGAIYGTLTNSGGVVYLQQNRFSKGNIIDIVVNSAYDATLGVAYALGEVLGDHPAVEVFIAVPARLLMSYIVGVQFTAGTGVVGADFLLNGIKVGSTYYNLPVTEGITRSSTSVAFVTHAWTPVLEPGTYEVQPIFGIVSGTPTIDLVENRQTYVKAIAE